MDLLSQMKHRLVASRVFFAAERRLSQLLARRWRAGAPEATHPPTHLLLAAPGSGSVGDQAMFEAFVEGVTGDVLVIVRSPETLLRMRPEFEERVSVLVLPELLYGSTRSYLRDLRVLVGRFATGISFSVIGADIMDGAYNARASSRRFWLAAFAAQSGLSSRVLGFSWNTHPAPSTRDAARWASRSVDLLARDPRSGERLRALGAQNVHDVADLAFLVPTSATVPEHIATWLSIQRDLGRNVVVVNANYLLEKEINQVGIMSTLISSHLSQSTSFVLLPHDSRKAPSDETLAAAISAAAGSSDHLLLVDRVLMPDEVVELTSRVDFVITGRMHLAILSAIAGTPAIAISYQGKIEGLYRNLDLDCFLTTEGDFARALEAQYQRVSANLASVRARMIERVPAMKSLAEENFTGLREQG
ncbi:MULTISPECIES: polysaccharide pyruvyl transferase family protein [unclassified Plantibacter]|uniref:polysaccharide pyruvyl transferase family protein n=1 Tax=unclassified Plantibacter TaxID=2624265 RepID=UPI0009E802E0|nr:MULTISPECIES: polysaccharide pyruvyl transferase family protein [unclassified Plantibacter]